jgi:hypothetical protein
MTTTRVRRPALDPSKLELLMPDAWDASKGTRCGACGGKLFLHRDDDVTSRVLDLRCLLCGRDMARYWPDGMPARRKGHLLLSAEAERLLDSLPENIHGNSGEGAYRRAAERAVDALRESAQTGAKLAEARSGACTGRSTD